MGGVIKGSEKHPAPLAEKLPKQLERQSKGPKPSGRDGSSAAGTDATPREAQPWSLTVGLTAMESQAALTYADVLLDLWAPSSQLPRGQSESESLSRLQWWI